MTRHHKLTATNDNVEDLGIGKCEKCHQPAIGADERDRLLCIDCMFEGRDFSGLEDDQRPRE